MKPSPPKDRDLILENSIPTETPLAAHKMSFFDR
jgi:hypothetical protein